jgi:hypothetical protein
MEMRKVVTVGQYLIARSSKFVARTSHMTNQRSKPSTCFLVFEDSRLSRPYHVVI